MIDRVSFIESVSGIKYPEMLINFFDQFIALKQLVENCGTISVINCSEKNIVFNIKFCSCKNCNEALETIGSLGGVICIYGKNINITTEVLTEDTIQITLQ